MNATKPKPVPLTPKHVAAFADWLEGTGAVSTAQVIRRMGEEGDHAAALQIVRRVMHQLSTTIVEKGGG